MRCEGQHIALPAGPKDLQSLELLPHRAGGWVFPLSNLPRLIWRDAAMATSLGLQNPPQVRWFDQSLQPLGCGDVILGNASSDAEMTAAELSALGQLLLGRGTYRGHQFFRPETFEQLLPQSLSVTDAPANGYGVGLHWIRHRRPSSEPKGQQEGELLFSNNTIGHGSFSGCILVIDLDRKLVISQARREFREQDNPWFQRYFAVVVDAVKP
jgi:hypothetical protein